MNSSVAVCLYIAQIYIFLSRRNGTFWPKVGETGVGEMGVGEQGPILVNCSRKVSSCRNPHANKYENKSIQPGHGHPGQRGMVTS